MGYTVTIRNNHTGEERSNHYDLTWHGFWWSLDGNMGCDCNRELEFERANTTELFNDIETECGDGRFDVVKIVLDSGEDVTASVDNLNCGQ